MRNFMDVTLKHLQAVLFGKVRSILDAKDMDEKWQTGHPHLDMQECFLWREEQKKQAKQAAKISMISEHNC